MSENERERPRASQLRQAWAWLDATDPEESRRWEERFDSFFGRGESVAEAQLDWELHAHWRGHRDDLMPEHIRGAAELAQAEAWLGPETERIWHRAHGLARTETTASHDRRVLVELWRTSRDTDGPTARTREYYQALRSVREAHLELAKTRARGADPAAFEQWRARRGFADSVADAYGDDRHLMRQWLAATDEPVNARHETGASALPITRSQPEPPRQPDATRTAPTGTGSPGTSVDARTTLEP